MDYSAIRMPEPRIYCYEDLFPGKWDPRCTPRFPLGNFWPVYVGNFWCEVYSEHATKVQEYFASKGLLVRMVFGREPAEDPHFKHQRVYHLYDFLVYFVRQQDADDAISYCHREMYYGHRLNVFPGRDPIYFDETRTLKFTLNDYFSGATEQVIEEIIQERTVAEVECVVKHSKLVAYVELVSAADIGHIVKRGKIRHLQIEQHVGQIRKQRFLEQDVELEIAKLSTKDPNFMQMVPPDYVLQALFQACVPDTGRRLPNRLRSVRYPKPHLNAEEYREIKKDEEKYVTNPFYSDFENAFEEFIDELKNSHPDEDYAEFVRRRRLAVLAERSVSK